MFTTAKSTAQKSDGAESNMENEGGHVMHDHATHDIRESARHIKNDVRAAAAHLRGDVEGAARQTGRHARELADAAGHSVSDLTQSVATKLRDNPVQSSLIALGVGLVLGMLYRR